MNFYRIHFCQNDIWDYKVVKAESDNEAIRKFIDALPKYNNIYNICLLYIRENNRDYTLLYRFDKDTFLLEPIFKEIMQCLSLKALTY
jgi:hypothetical protein